MEVLFPVFKEISTLFSIAAVLVCIPKYIFSYKKFLGWQPITLRLLKNLPSASGLYGDWSCHRLGFSADFQKAF